MTRVVVVGGGIAGLSIAHAIRVTDSRSEVLVLERSSRPGGNVRTDVIDGYTCEYGPDGFLDNAPATLKLVEEVGLSHRLCPSSDAARRRFVFGNGRLHEVPSSTMAFLTTRLLSGRGKLRIAWEPLARRRPDEDETIHAFAARRIGREAADVLVDAMVSGVIGGDARELSLRACFPRMWELETTHGSLFNALLATRKTRRKGDAVGAPTGRLTSFTNGMEELIYGIVTALGPHRVRASTRVFALWCANAYDQLARTAPPRYSLLTSNGTVDADAVVLAGPANGAADIVRTLDAPLASVLDEVAFAPIVVACLGYDQAALARARGPLNGFGFLVPRRERPRILGALWETSIYPNRAPAGKALLRVMIGGANDREAAGLDDHSILQILRTDLARTMGLRIAPEFVRVIRHPRGIPQYTVGHTDRLTRIDALLGAHPGLFLAGNSYRGVSINACVADAAAIAARVTAYLRSLAMRGAAVIPA